MGGVEWSIFGVGGIDLVGLEWENGRFWGCDFGGEVGKSGVFTNFVYI